MATRKALIGALSVLALLIVSTTDSQAQGRTSVMVDSKLDNASFLWRVKGKMMVGARLKIKDASPAPLLRYYVTGVKGIRLFVQAEAGGIGGLTGGKKKGKGAKDGLGGIDLGIGGEYFFRRNLSVVAFLSGGSTLNLQYYF